MFDHRTVPSVGCVFCDTAYLNAFCNDYLREGVSIGGCLPGALRGFPTLLTCLVHDGSSHKYAN